MANGEISIERKNLLIYEKLFKDQKGWRCNYRDYNFYTDFDDLQDAKQRIGEKGWTKEYLIVLDEILNVTGQVIDWTTTSPLMRKNDKLVKYLLASPSEIAEAIYKTILRKSKEYISP